MASGGGRGGDGGAAAVAPPALQLSLRLKSSSVVENAPVGGCIPSSRVAEVDGAIETRYSPDGQLFAVVRADDVLLYSTDNFEAPLCSLREVGVCSLVFSPRSTRLVTLRKRINPRIAADDAPNVRVWDPRTGAEVGAIFSKASTEAHSWPALQWTADEQYVCRMTADGLLVLDGATLAPVLSSTKIPAAQSFWVAPVGGPEPPAVEGSGAAAAAAGSGGGGRAPVKRHAVITFTPRTKSKPAAVCVWSLPPTPAPVASKNLQSDACRVQFNCNGTAALAELSTASSASSYYGDSRVFLFSMDGRLSAAVAQPKEGPVHDFAWSPADPAQFLCIAGKSPPQATLHALPKGEATFSFGTGPYNTIKYQPQGRLALLGGFGNMSGDVQVWDVRRCRPASPPFSTPVATTLEWAPDGRTLVAATCKPRLNVDNGYRLWSYRGQLLSRVELETLFDAAWRPAPAGAFPDRPPSPSPAAAAKADRAAAAAGAGGSAVGAAPATASAATAAPKPAPPVAVAAAPVSAIPGLAPGLGPAGPVAAAAAGALGGGKGAYVPPHLRGTGAANTVTALMKEGHRKAERLGPAAAAAASAAAPAPAIPGMDPTAGKKKRRRKKKDAGAAAGAGGGSSDGGSDD